MKFKNGIIIGVVLLGVGGLVGGLSYNGWKYTKEPVISFYYDGEFISKAKTSASTPQLREYTQDDLSNKRYFMQSWYSEYNDKMNQKITDLYNRNIEVRYDAKFYSKSVLLEDLMYIGNNEYYGYTIDERTTVATYFNCEDSGIYKMVGFPKKSDNPSINYLSSRWVILYDFKDTIGKDNGMVCSKLMYMSETNEHYTDVFDRKKDGDNSYLDLLEDYDACYNIDFKYNRFDSQVNELFYNKDVVSDETIEIYTKMLEHNLKDYNQTAEKIKAALIETTFSYFTDNVDLKDC